MVDPDLIPTPPAWLPQRGVVRGLFGGLLAQRMVEGAMLATLCYNYVGLYLAFSAAFAFVTCATTAVLAAWNRSIPGARTAHFLVELGLIPIGIAHGVDLSSSLTQFVGAWAMHAGIGLMLGCQGILAYTGNLVLTQAARVGI